jgi:hypothetical protein
MRRRRRWYNLVGAGKQEKKTGRDAMAEPTSAASDSVGAADAHQTPFGKVPTRAERVEAAMGKFAWVPFSSEDLVREKQEELEQEEPKPRNRGQ